MNRFIPIAVLVAAPLMATSVRAQLDDVDSVDRTPVECINVGNLRRTEVLDDQTVLFYMRGTRVYLNHLPRSCPTLEREERFAYRTTGRRLCRVDTITVLDRAGFGGITCQLGHFHPVTAEEVEELREGPSSVEARPADPAELDTPEDDDTE